MLELAHKTNATILLASTSEIYGQPLVHPQEESYFGNVNTLGPRACYDEGKRIAETLAFNFWMQKQVNIKIARIFNTYGPNMRLDDGRVITNFIGQLLNGKPLTIYGDGLTTRSFCYVSDTVNALRLIMTSEGEYLYNVGNPQEISLLTLVDELERLTNSPGRSIHWLDKPQDDPVRRKPDISKIYSKLGWKPKIDLHDGLKQTIDYFQQCNLKPTVIPSPMKAAV
jgi:UDP-glucuronate decarboxylase